MDLAFELHDLVRTLDAHAEAMLRTSGLSLRRYVALVIVSEHPGLTGRQLAAGLGISEAATSAIVRRLLDDGVVHDVARPGAGNVRMLALTDAGEASVERAGALLGDALDHAVRGLGLNPAVVAATIRSIHDEVSAPHRSKETP